MPNNTLLTAAGPFILGQNTNDLAAAQLGPLIHGKHAGLGWLLQAPYVTQVLTQLIGFMHCKDCRSL